ncbi:hypothetical protein BDV38DRAFT_276220 [Aspergillus pseudotamarii]|uniref:Aminoglycoside phosphotransferase domain-containing protein n=1 Tax=Aspergillus pseudotamarii TaxID=132259 RepID=A0A5N6S8V2_ASPPS|nr:uncharacterized protein BDV38DRAFT_276220 [Aspergillus pseudotamarii]KAE8131108.1 hypothetical protein BDV38DRAFT_276220 [Aspergillus pseudotamarii]
MFSTFCHLFPGIYGLEIDFTDTSFFTSSPNRHLPTPAQVRALSKDIDTCPQPTPIKFENLNLIVKFGLYVKTAEALNLWMIKKVFHNKCRDSLGTMEKGAISDQLSQIMESLRRLEQDPSDQFIGSIHRQSLLDYVFIGQLITGPFSSTKEFNDWLASIYRSRFPNRYGYRNRCSLPDNGEIKLTHAELNPRNIIVSSFTPVEIVVINWRQAGWYPDYWEYCKALDTCWDDRWRKGYVDKVLQSHADAFFVWSEYCMVLGTN